MQGGEHRSALRDRGAFRAGCQGATTRRQSGNVLDLRAAALRLDLGVFVNIVSHVTDMMIY